jgi:hypothetical protein
MTDSKPGNTTFYLNGTYAGSTTFHLDSPVQMVGNIVCAGSQQWGVFDELKIWSRGGEVPGYALRRGLASLTPQATGSPLKWSLATGSLSGGPCD